jgi:Transglutaminase-like superfamily
MSNHSRNGTATAHEPGTRRPLPIPRQAEDLLSASDSELAAVDPALMNLLVAKGIPSLQDLDIHHYLKMLDEWADAIREHLPAAEANFYRTPHRWKNDVRFSHLALMCWYVGTVLDIQYREDQKYLTRVLYTDPGDLFLNGVMDSRRGTCGNMAMVHVALGWRLGWPVSLACVASHFICRYDDGEVIHNIEATNNTGGGFHSPPDEYYVKEYKLSEKAIGCGSDLRAVTPREMLGLFFGARARHLENTHRLKEAEVDYLLARYLFPQNRKLHTAQHQTSVQIAIDLFEPYEKGHPIELASWLQEVVRVASWKGQTTQPFVENPNAAVIDALFSIPDGG